MGKFSSSGIRVATAERLQDVDDKYAADYYDINMIDKWFKEASVMCQVSGSPRSNTPRKFVAVDETYDVQTVV